MTTISTEVETLELSSRGMVAVLGLWMTFVASAQTTNAPVPKGISGTPLPKDASALLEIGSRTDGLTGADLKPWHLKGTYEQYDSDGDNIASGTFEEIWVSDKKYRRSYHSEKFTQTDYATENGLFREGNQKWPNIFLMKVRSFVINPVPNIAELDNVSLIRHSRKIAGLKLECVLLKRTNANISIRVLGYSEDDQLPQYCFDPDKPVLRFSAPDAADERVTYNNILLFRGHYVASDVEMRDSAKRRLTIHVETLESANEPAESEFVPPPSASKLTEPMQVPMAALTMLKMPDIRDRNAAKGKWVVKVVFDRDGHAKEAHVVSGPTENQELIITGVKKMEVRPFVVMGNPVEVEGEINYTIQ